MPSLASLNITNLLKVANILERKLTFYNHLLRLSRNIVSFNFVYKFYINNKGHSVAHYSPVQSTPQVLKTGTWHESILGSVILANHPSPP